MMRKNVKRAPPKAKGGMSSLTMYRSRTSDLTALLYHSHVDRPSRELLTVALVLAALAGLGVAAVGDVWGGALLGVVGVDRLVVGAFRLADAPGVSTVRVYGRLRGEAALLATIHREGHPVVYPAAPAPDGAPQFVTAWEGASSG